MSRDKLIIAGVVLLGLLGVLVYEQAKKDDSEGKPSATAAETPTVAAPEDVDKISVTNGDKPEVVLEKVIAAGDAPTDGGVPDGKWVLTKPVKADANQQAVKDLLANLKDLKANSPVNIKLDDEVKKDKQLDPAHALHLIAWKGGTKKIDELFGKSGPVGNLTIVTDKPNDVWAVKGYSSYLYAKEAKDFRDKEIFKFDDANATGVTLTNTHGTFAFAKSDATGKWTGTANNKPIERFDGEKVKDLLRSYKALSADDFGDGKTVVDTGLDKPVAQLTVRLNDGKTEDLLVGPVSTGTSHWAKRASDDSIYQITSYATDWVTADVSKYQSAADAGPGESGKATTAKLEKKK
jgi:hypothetical protein